jgi:hypothetical protein
MSEQIQINNNNNLVNNISYISNDNSNNKQNIINNSFNAQTTQYYGRKKNPREMSIEELEEYIEKSRNKIKNYKNYESQSLNASFNNNNNFGFFDKIDNNNKNENLYSVKRTENTKKFMNSNEDNNLKLNIKLITLNHSQKIFQMQI